MDEAFCETLRNKPWKPRLEVPIGKVFGWLTVIGFGEPRQMKGSASSHRQTWLGATWQCRCECGAIIECIPDRLRSGANKSCGCKRAKYSSADAAARDLYTMYRASAIKRGLEFSISLEQFLTITSEECFFCPALPSNPHYARHKRKRVENMPYISNGIDRLDNNLGYTTRNCVPCCATCNAMKSDHTYDAFISKCREIVTKHDTRQAQSAA
jgi:hypothetical protein